MLPLAVVVAPLWVRHRTRLDRRRHMLLALLVAGFGILVLLGYVLDLRWTGFPGNELWDWLQLLALPLAIALLPVWSELSQGLDRRHALVAGCAVVALAVTIVGGYSYGWRWTGFEGNTLFDWFRLVVAPLLLAFVLAPLIGRWVVPDPPEQ